MPRVTLRADTVDAMKYHDSWDVGGSRAGSRLLRVIVKVDGMWRWGSWWMSGGSLIVVVEVVTVVSSSSSKYMTEEARKNNGHTEALTR